MFWCGALKRLAAWASNDDARTLPGGLAGLGEGRGALRSKAFSGRVHPIRGMRWAVGPQNPTAETPSRREHARSGSRVVVPSWRAYAMPGLQHVELEALVVAKLRATGGQRATASPGPPVASGAARSAR